MSNRKGVIIAVSAPSGTGKTTIVKKILEEFPDLVFSISATTRQKRDNEIEGVDYFFITENEFKKKIDNGEFVEWEKFYDYYYGTYKSFIEGNIDKGKSVIVEIDVNGALSLKKIYPKSILIFIYPPSFEELKNRLKKRNTEDEADYKKRIERAKMELSLKPKFDYLIENKDLEKALLETKNLIGKIINQGE
ncbi:MAG: guanylate kinase [Bacteroidetes bacterium]|nr:guanylate kinase [Bacteroidota bacterium]